MVKKNGISPGKTETRRGGHRFWIVDVFGEEKYSGNQLAVVLPSRPIADGEMQRIAREFNFPETTFVTDARPGKRGYRVRIFTPGREVPFAGHPTLGTAYVIRKLLAKAPVPEIVLDLKAGRIPVRFEAGAGGLLWMKQLPPVFGKRHAAKDIARILGLKTGDIDPLFPIQEVSTGMAFLLIPLRGLAEVKRARTDMAAYRKYFGGKYFGGKDSGAADGLPLFLFSRETYAPENRINARMFADIFGIPEDPATGSANGCLAAYLAEHGYFGTPAIEARVEQGYEIGRKSILHLEARPAGKGLAVRVGGPVIEVAEGRLL